MSCPILHLVNAIANPPSFNLVIQEKLFADLIFVRVVQCTVGKQESGNAVTDIQFGDHVQNPGIVGIGYTGYTIDNTLFLRLAI